MPLPALGLSPPLSPHPTTRLRADVAASLRSSGEVQIGIDAGSGIIVGGLSETESQWLLSLNRRSTPRRQSAPSPQRTDELVSLLQAHRLLSIDPALQSRWRAPQLPSSKLYQSQPTVSLLGRGTIVGILRAQAHRCGMRVLPASEQGVDITVLLASPAIAMHDAQEWAGSNRAHLPVVVRPGYASIGPLVARRGGPCLHCLDLARTDRDPDWPSVLGSMASRSLGTGPPISSNSEVTSAVAALTTMILRAHAEGLQVPEGVAWDLHPPSPVVTAHRWERHPRCTIGH